MDIVLFSRPVGDGDDGGAPSKLELGAFQEDGTIAPLSAWSEDPAFADQMEFVVDEELRLPGLTGDDVTVHVVLEQNLIGYGSRQVGGGKGPGNPHGEESELLYYVEMSVLGLGEGYEGASWGGEVEVVINPNLEILW